MRVDFLTILNESNSIKNEETGEITLITPKIESNDDLIISSKCKITSNCETIIVCPCFQIISTSASLENINFESTFQVVESTDVQLIKSNISKSKDYSAIVISNSQNITIKDIEIKDTDSHPAILIVASSSVLAENISISNIENEFLVCKLLSTLYLKDSNFINSKSNGISVSENSNIEISNSKISETIYPAIYVNNSKCKIENNEINNIQQNGIVLDMVKSFEINGNKFDHINGSAISIIDDSNGIINNNIISKIDHNGIYVHNHSEVKICNNNISECKYPGIAILMKSNAKLISNKISAISLCGICIRSAGKVKIKKSEIKDINENGISISDTKECLIKENNIFNCNISAIEAYDGSKVDILNNNITNIKEYSFLVYTLAVVKAENNKISDIGKAMVMLNYNGGGDFINNHVEKCPTQKEGQICSQYFLSGNGNFDALTNDNSRKNDNIAFEDACESEQMCIKCNKNHRNCYLLNCGHKVYCEECAKESLDNHETCPLCRCAISSYFKDFNDNNELCGICLKKPIECIVIPCGHIAFCHKCLDKWYHENKSCPTCRLEPVTYRTIYKF